MFVFTLLIGLFMLVTGAEMLVRGGSQIALVLRVPALVVGLTVVAFGTSTPELAVSLTAALSSSTEMALANVTGSNIANIALVLGVAALVCPLRVDRSLMKRELPVLLGLQLLVPITILSGRISRIEALILIFGGLFYNVWLLVEAFSRRRSLVAADGDDDDVSLENAPLWKHGILLVVGLVVLGAGAYFFVNGAEEIARRLGLSQRFIGLTVVAMGTSAPEIATAVVSAYRGQVDLAIGNSIGSNILNIAMVLGLTSVITPIEVSNVWASLGDLAVAVGVTFLLVPVVLSGSRLGRGAGLAMAGGYVLYLFVTPR